MTPSLSYLNPERACLKRCAEESTYSNKKRKLSIGAENDDHHASHLKSNTALWDNFESSTESSMSLHSAPAIVEDTLPSHPLGIKPLGNLYSATAPNIKIHAGFLAALPDEVLVQVLEHLNAHQLLRLGATCKALYAFTHHDELWKTLLVDSPLSTLCEGQQLDWHGSWLATYLSPPSENFCRIACDNLFSDSLYRPFHCANLPLHAYVNAARFRSHIPKLGDLTPEEFQNNWSDKPFILTEPVKSWRVFNEWDVSKLRQRYERIIFRCEAVDWPLRTYAQYMQDTSDESPLYLFDSQFVEKMNLRVCEPAIKSASDEADFDYTPPSTFYPDLFTVFGAERPSHRWLIIGPPRSGSTFHIDPNGTSAWNAVIKGRKYWIMCPEPPPGVYVSKDESEVTSPSSIAEWLLGFHAEARKIPCCYEGICEEGEVLHVPGGWYHLVINLPPANGATGYNVAITQNFVPKPRLSKVLTFLKEKPDQVSGFQFSDDNQHKTSSRSRGRPRIFSAYDLFTQRLNEQYPGLLERVAHDKRGKSDEMDLTRVTRWEKVVEAKEQNGTSFSFDFEPEDDEAI